MAQSDTPETAGADTFVQACGSPLGRISAPPLHCTRPRGHDGDHSDGVAGATWRDPDPGPPFVAGGTLTGKGGSGATTDPRGIVIGGQLAGMSSPGGGSSTGFASGGISGNGGQPSAGYASTHGQGGVAFGVAGVAGGAGPGGGIHEPGSQRLSVRCDSCKVLDGAPRMCARTPGHYGAHDDDRGHSWSAAPDLGPVPERFRQWATQLDDRPRHEVPSGAAASYPRTMPRPKELEPFAPGKTIEVLLAGLVACGRALGRIGHELEQRKHWKAVLSAGLKMLDATPDSELTDEQWSRLGRYLWAAVQLVADQKSEPPGPVQERAEALAILIMVGQRAGVPPNFLIRAGAVLEVLRAAWRKAQRGGT